MFVQKITRLLTFKKTVMKKLLVSLFVAFSMFAFVACESNPAIKAAKKFIDKPTKENMQKIAPAVKECDAEELEEYNEWYNKNRDELEKATKKALGL